MQDNAIPFNTMQYHSIPCNIMQYYAIQCNTMQYHAIPCNTTQYNTIPCNTMLYHASIIIADGAYHCPVGSIRPFLYQFCPESLIKSAKKPEQSCCLLSGWSRSPACDWNIFRCRSFCCSWPWSWLLKLLRKNYFWPRFLNYLGHRFLFAHWNNWLIIIDPDPDS